MSEFKEEREPVEAREERNEQADQGHEDTSGIESGLPDEVVVDQPLKVAHEDLPVRSVEEAELEGENDNTRDGEAFEDAPTAAELAEKREDERDEDEA